MALKYWYVAGNGSSNFSTAGVWYNGPGGTGGTTTTPTAADDAIVNAASGSGTLTIAATATVNSLNLKTFTGTFAGTSALNISTSSTTNNSGIALQLGGTHNYSGTITFTSSAFTALDIECNGIFHKGNMTFNSAGKDWNSGAMPLNLTGTLTLTAGNIYSVALYAGAFSSSNANSRSFIFDDVYLSGTGTLFNVSTQTNLINSVIYNGLYSTSTASVNRSISISGIISVNGIYIQGSGSALTSIAITSTIGNYPNIIISKTGGTLSISQSSIINLTFIEGSTIQWASTAQLTVYGNLILCNSMSISTSNNLLFAGGAMGVGYQQFYTFNKTFTGWLQVNDSGNFVTNLDVIGNYTSTTISTNPQAINITNCSQVQFLGNINLTTGINVNGTNSFGYGVNAYFQSVISATSLAINSAGVTLGSATFSGNITLTSGSLNFTNNAIINTFAFLSTSNTTDRSLVLGNATINLNGNTGNVWQIGGIIQGTMYLYAGTSTININDKTLGSVTFVGGDGSYNNLTINRSNNFVSNSVYTIITGSNNAFKNFKDLTINPNGTEHYIAFASSSTTYIYDTFQVGNSINITRLIQTTSAPYALYKATPGLVICPNVYIGNSIASSIGNNNTWYAISGSLNAGGNSGWIFDTPPRRLGSLGAG
jgi:hypothetical protein